MAGAYTIPEGVANVGSNSFNHCIYLTSIAIPAGVNNIGDYAFAECHGLSNATFAGTVTKIGSQVFSLCENLNGITVPGSIMNIGAYAFYYSGIRSATVAPGVPRIGDQMFSTCTNLTNVVIPLTVTNLGQGAFALCANLHSLTIPESVTSIDQYAFDGSGLSSVFFTGNAPVSGTGLFKNAVNNPKVYYLPGTKGWSNTFAGVPAILWNPVLQTNSANFGLRSNRFGFNIAGTANIPIAVQACTNLGNSVWANLQTLNLTNGSYYFSEPFQTNQPSHFYRISSP